MPGYAAERRHHRFAEHVPARPVGDQAGMIRHLPDHVLPKGVELGINRAQVRHHQLQDRQFYARIGLAAMSGRRSDLL